MCSKLLILHHNLSRSIIQITYLNQENLKNIFTELRILPRLKTRYISTFYIILQTQNILFMTIQQVIANEKEINQLVLEGKMLEAFEKFYGENIVMIESDGSQNLGKEACRKYEEGFMSTITQFNEAKLLSSIVIPLGDNEFEVMATWYNDIVTTNYPIKGNQTSTAIWKDGMIQKVTFKSGSEIIV
jgi:hypothetical protein